MIGSASASIWLTMMQQLHPIIPLFAYYTTHDPDVFFVNHSGIYYVNGPGS